MTKHPDYFELFGLDPVYPLDVSLLSERYRELQRIYHPDRHVGKSAQEIRLSVQKSSWVNQAYDVLKSPVDRALYLLELKDNSLGVGHLKIRDTAFLMRQMVVREELQEVMSHSDPFPELKKITDQANSDFNALEKEFIAGCVSSDLQAAVEAVAKMQFYAKFLHDIDEMEARLDD